jgi:ABC-type sugar transport system substrate-binding protein
LRQVALLPSTQGTLLGDLIVDACQDLDPCNVGYLFAYKGSPYDSAARQFVDQVLVEHPTIEIVAEGEGHFLPQDEMAALNDMLQGNPDIDVIASVSDPPAVVTAVNAQGRQGEIEIVSVGGSDTAVAKVADGDIFGLVAVVPHSAGGAAAEIAIQAARGEPVDDPGVDSIAELGPGIVTQANAGSFSPEFKGAGG